MVISHHAPAQFKFFTSHQSPVTSHEIQLYFSRGRKGSGDPPGLQSRRFGSSRVEWWVRLPHASATSCWSDGSCKKTRRQKAAIPGLNPVLVSKFSAGTSDNRIRRLVSALCRKPSPADWQSSAT